MRGLWQKQVENSHRPATAGRGATARNRSADGKQEKLLHCFAVLAGCGTSPGSAGLPSGLVSVSVCDTGRVTGGSDPSGSTGSTVKENQRAAAGGSRWEDARCTSVLKTRIGEPQQRRRGKRAAKGAKAATRAHRPRTQRGRTRPHSQQQPRGAREGRGAERYGAARSGTERYGAERSGTERSGAERSDTVHACKLPRSILPKTRRSSGDDHRKNMWSLSGSGRAHLGYGWWKVFSLSFKARTSALLRGAVPAALLLHMRGAGRLA
ncbi:uncharacterized protein [Anas platyrhynchos]|uniref:uncharacterized protein isoform X4 n=1 Tax=Anas platyrhynchos TaxID=8839 RepID=UPI003AF244E2